jgi:1-acyl-sn-glycerol-3-phosphate acyltransferase
MHALAQTIRSRARLAPIVAAALGALGAYRVSARCVGPSAERALALFQRWCRWVWPRLRLDVEVDGHVSTVPCVYVSNHRSYLDIPVLGGVLGACFLSRSDVAAWPVIGASAEAIGTIFIDRDDPHSAARAARALTRLLRSQSIVVFPEGTTGGGALPQPFVGGLFRLLSRLRTPVVPVTIRYSDRSAYWIDERPIAEHLTARMTARRRLAASVHIGAALAIQASSDAGELLAHRAYDAVCAPIAALGELTAESAQH